MDTFVIDRAKWFNGRDIQYSKDFMIDSVASSLSVPSFNKQCCLGIYLTHRGISKEMQDGYVTPADIAKNVIDIDENITDDSIEALYCFISDNRLGYDMRIKLNNESKVNSLMKVNDNIYIDDEFREDDLKERFAKLDIKVEFIGEYVDGINLPSKLS